MRTSLSHISTIGFLLSASLLGCYESEADGSLEWNARPEFDAGYRFDSGTTSGSQDVGFGDSSVVTTCEVAAPGVDTDGDGIQDVVEDRNLNCLVDPGETDPFLADTDGDGLLDGEEDVDRNGQFDAARGEFDPTNPDTDGDGILDGAEAAASVCVSSVAGRAIRSTAMFADGRLVLVPVDWSVGSNEANDVLWAQSPHASVAYMAGVSASAWAESPTERLRELFAPIDGVEVHEVVISHGETRWWQFEVSGDRELETSLVAELLGVQIAEQADAEEDDEAPEGSGTRDLSSGSLLVELSVDPASTRVTLGVYEDGERPGNFDWATSPTRISPGAGQAVRAFCEEQTPTGPGLPVTVVVGDVRNNNQDSVRAILGTIWSELQSKGLLSEGFFAPADVHVTASLSSWLSTGAPYSFDDVLRELVDLEEVSDDQRLWTNSLALVSAVRTDPGFLDQEIVLVVVAAAEDTSYREGTYDGRDGSPGGAAIPAGTERDALDAFHVAELQRAGVRLVSVGPDARHAEGCLSNQGLPRPGIDPEPPPMTSYQRLALATDGVWLDTCRLPDSRGLATFLRNRIPSAFLPNSEPLLAGIIEAPSADSLIQPAQSGLTSYAVSGTSESEIPLVRLVWEE